MDKHTQARAQSLKAKHTQKQTHQRIQNTINCLQKSMCNMEGLLERLDSAHDDAERAQVMNMAINHLVCNIQPNLRIDLLAHSQAEFAASMVYAN